MAQRFHVGPRRPRPARHPCVHHGCTEHRGTVPCANAKNPQSVHYVCPKHVYPATDALGREYCSQQCWDEHQTDFTV